MGSYDSPSWTDRTPAGVVAQTTGLGGSQPTEVPDASAEPGRGTIGNSALVVPVSGSVINGDRVTVGPLDTLVGHQADVYSGSDGDPISGLPGDYLGQTGIGKGHVLGGGGQRA
jgi:hypothetical protein